MFEFIMNIIQENYIRKQLRKNSLYVFTDNLNRSSGRNVINENTPYYKKYGNGNILCYPTVTTAQIRGCENAFPIITMKTQYKVQLSDLEFESNCQVISDEINTIYQNAFHYDNVVFPFGQIGVGKYSNMKTFCPNTFSYLQNEMSNLILKLKKI